MRDLLREYLDGCLSRREFFRQLVAAGFTATAAESRRVTMIMLPMLIRQGGSAPCRFVAVEE